MIQRWITREYDERLRREHPEVYLAHLEVAKALYRGEIKRKKCKCGNEKVIAHHPDYSKPLEIEWMCQSCHMKYHKGRSRQ